MISTARRTTASLSEAKNWKTGLRCQLRRGVGEGVTMYRGRVFSARTGTHSTFMAGTPRGVLPGLLQRVAEGFQVDCKRGCVERVQDLYVVEELAQLCLDLKVKAAIVIQRVGQPIQRQDETLCALAKDGDGHPPCGKFVVDRSQRSEE